MNQRVRVLITGRVQGVSYRYAAAEAARRLGVKGWVRNRPDGAVEGEFEGDAKAVDDMCAWCRKGPPAALVEEVRVVEHGAPAGHDAFRIRY